MRILKESDKEYLRNLFKKKLNRRVSINYYCDENENCKILESLLNDLKETSEKIEVKKTDEKFDYYPAIYFEVENKKLLNFKFFGLPIGYEFSVFIENIINISRNEIEVSEDVEKMIKNVKSKVYVFVTPSCPYCPYAVKSAFKLAMKNENIDVSIFEAMEFPELSMKFDVQAVPTIVINEKRKIVGALSEEELAKEIALESVL